MKKRWTLTGAAGGSWLCAGSILSGREEWLRTKSNEISGIFTVVMVAVVAEFHSHGWWEVNPQVEANWYTTVSWIIINRNLRNDDDDDKRHETGPFSPRPISFSGPNFLKGSMEFLPMILLCMGSCFNPGVMTSFPLDLVHFTLQKQADFTLWTWRVSCP